MQATFHLTGNRKSFTGDIGPFNFVLGVTAMELSKKGLDRAERFLRYYAAVQEGTKEFEEAAQNGTIMAAIEAEAEGPRGPEELPSALSLKAGARPANPTLPQGQEPIKSKPSPKGPEASERDGESGPEASPLELVLLSLDPDNNAYWTSSGLPRLEALEALLPEPVERKDVELAVPGFNRRKAWKAKKQEKK